MRATQFLAVVAFAGLRHSSKGEKGPFSSEHPSMVNPWGASKPFRFLDDMFPVAPEDKLPQGTDWVGYKGEKPMYIPAYTVSDPFPQGARLFKTVHVPGEDPIVVATDPSYGNGDAWNPNVAQTQGIVAPASRMDRKHYPLHAPFDKFSPMPALGPEDILPQKYARYLDQVNDRARGCGTGNGGYVNDACTVECQTGSVVQAVFGNVLRDVTLEAMDEEHDLAQVSWDASLPEDPETGTHGPVNIERRRLSVGGKTCNPSPGAAPMPAAPVPNVADPNAP